MRNTALLTWDDFFAASTITNTEAKRAAAVELSTFVDERAAIWDQIMAAAMVSCIPAIVFLFFLQRYLVFGLTAACING